jgi:hypothetical protein
LFRLGGKASPIPVIRYALFFRFTRTDHDRFGGDVIEQRFADVFAGLNIGCVQCKFERYLREVREVAILLKRRL